MRTQFGRAALGGGLAVFVATGGVGAQDQQPFARARHALRSAVASGSVGSAVGLIARGGRIVFLEAAGEAGAGVPMTTDAIARLASITKPITATAVMILVEEGKLGLSDPLERFFPDWGSRVLERENGTDSLVPVTRPATVFDLLTHQSGISTDDPEFDGLWNEAKTAEEFARLIGARPLRFQPGSRFHYGYMGSGYEVLAGLVERVTGASFEDFITRRILLPLGMRDTHFQVPSAKRHRLAAQYRQDSSGRLIRFRERGQEEPPTRFFSGGGGLRSTVTDYFRFAQFLLARGERDGERLLRAETVDRMVTNQVGSSYPAKGYGWGFGVRVRTDPGEGPDRRGNFGWNGGTGTQFLGDPTADMVVIIFAPSTPGSTAVNRLREEFIEAAYQR